MTDTKAKHLGRACALACKLAEKVVELYGLRYYLHVEVQRLAGSDVADEFVKAIITSDFARHEIGRLFSELIEKVEGGAK